MAELKATYNQDFVKEVFKETKAVLDNMTAIAGAQMGFDEMDPEIVGIFNECVKLFNTLKDDSLEWARQQDLHNEEIMSQLRLTKERDQILIGMVKDLSDQVKKLTSKKGGE